MYGACHVDKRYFVCEYTSDGELRTYSKKPDNEHLKWQKMYEVALGLEYLYGQNVAHNDLKCDSIMVGMYGKAKLIDFGLSCLLNEAKIQIDVKKMDAVNWRSPEYLAGGRPSFALDGTLTSAAIRYQVKKGNIPELPDSVNWKQRYLIQLMTKSDSSKRVRMAFVVDKLNELSQEERAVARAS